jgi:sirohydrochlorin ferrochelatase
MKAFLILAHGSRRAQSNEEVIQLAECFATQNDAEYPLVRAAFMELAKPDIPETIHAVLEAGATELVILPYFLAAGAHVVEDIPEILHECLADKPEVNYRVLPHIGGAKGMIGLMQQVASDD